MRAANGFKPTRQAWLMSRVISAQKASTAASISRDTMALSTANLYAATQPGGMWYGLLEQNLANQNTMYMSNLRTNGTANDGLRGRVIGGVNVVGGGLPLYGNVVAVSTSANSSLIGGLGVSGDTSCTDHAVAWAVRRRLGMGTFPATDFTAVGGNNVNGYADNIIYDIPPAAPNAGVENTRSASGWGHPQCAAGNVAPTRTAY